MGRKLMRVPFDFKWPLNKTWEGYLNPHYRRCPDCENGYSPAGDWLRKAVQDIVWRLPGDRHNPDPEAVALTTALCGRGPSSGFGHDSIDEYSAWKYIIKAAGMPENWGLCKTCGGSAEDPATKEASEAWKPYEPPAGEGYQLWETTSEGSPISPVFSTLDRLCQWCERNASTFGSERTSAARWKEMLSEDNVCHTEGNVIFI